VSNIDIDVMRSLLSVLHTLLPFHAQGGIPLCRPMALAKFLKETYGKQSVLDAVKAGGWKAFKDGTLA